MTTARVLQTEEAHSLSAPVMILIGVCSLIYLLDGLIHSILGPLAPDMARSLTLSNARRVGAVQPMPALGVEHWHS